MNSILNRANGMTNGAAGTVLLYDLRESVVSVELDCLVTRVSTSKEAATALKAVLIIDFWNKELILCHFINWRNMLEFGANKLEIA